MHITSNILGDFFAECGWTVCGSIPKNRAYQRVRPYFPGCDLQPDTLYILPALSPTLSLPSADLCLLNSSPQWEHHPSTFSVMAEGVSFSAFYSAVQDLFDRFSLWDQQLSQLLLQGGTLQQILDCSAPILKNPCFFQDNQYYVLASYDQTTPEENPFFYETVETGRTPSRFFETLLTLPPQLKDSYLPRNSIAIVQRSPRSKELLCNVFFDGVPILRFCMACTNYTGSGAKDIVSHLMEQLKAAPNILTGTPGGITSYDCLFARIIDDPTSPSTAETAASLGLHQYALFAAVAIDFHTSPPEVGSTMTKLQILHPNIHFFLYQNTPYALLGAKRKSSGQAETLDALQTVLCARLEQLGARCGISIPFTSLQALGPACSQALYALSTSIPAGFSLSGQAVHTAPGCRYADLMPLHMLETFFKQHPFELYCHHQFKCMLDDDAKSETNNAQLLYVYLSHECNATVTARALHMHRNNVIYRINKLKEKYSIDLDDSGQRLLIQLLCLAVGLGCRDGSQAGISPP